MKSILYEQITELFSFTVVLYCLLYTVTIFVNKYILSVLKFTYPTVFQGWQTLVASIFLLVMKNYSNKDNLKQTVHGHGIKNMLPILVFHVFGIVAGSKALSAISIPVFLGTANITSVAIHISLNKTLTRFHLIFIILIVITSTILLLSHQKHISDGSNVWLLTHIFFIIVDALYSNFVDLKISRIKRLWYSNLFSVMTLAPASLYLQEAFSALDFASLNEMKFFISVIVSGVCGGMTQVLSMNIDNAFIQPTTVAVAAVLSQIVFIDDALVSPFLQVLVINLVSNILLSFSSKMSEKNPIELTVI